MAQPAAAGPVPEFFAEPNVAPDAVGAFLYSTEPKPALKLKQIKHAARNPDGSVENIWMTEPTKDDAQITDALRKCCVAHIKPLLPCKITPVAADGRCASGSILAVRGYYAGQQIPPITVRLTTLTTHGRAPLVPPEPALRLDEPASC